MSERKMFAKSGSFHELSDEKKKRVMTIASEYHYRDCVKSPDGSRGTVIITYKQLLDLIATLSEE